MTAKYLRSDISLDGQRQSRIDGFEAILPRSGNSPRAPSKPQAPQW